MYKTDKIKLIIWDLDDTFWNGTLSEGEVSIPEESVQLLKESTDAGIINSICSKNDPEQVEKRFKEEGLLDYFVFPSVNWESKSSRVREIILNMQLREENVLFLDDNHFNIEEVKYYCPKIMTAGPDSIKDLLHDIKTSGKKDPEHKRLKQYKILEQKKTEKEHFTSNEEFLRDCQIRVEIKHDCKEHISRIHDLILRANQLNFTKVRCSEEELEALLQDTTIQSGYAEVSDRFGEYGIVGFYAIKDNILQHFVFSCRTLGMGIEQYVYQYLGRPELKPVGEVISDLSEENAPYWINMNKPTNRDSGNRMRIKELKEHTVLVKGPCDLFQIYPYIADTEMFDTEFTYTTAKGLVVESVGHTTNIREAGRLTKEQKNLVLREVPFTDAGMYSDNIFQRAYKVIFLSILTDANLGVYARKGTGESFAFLEYNHPLTDPANWDAYVKNEYLTGGFKYTEKILKEFSEKYDFLGRNTPDQIVQNIDYIRNKIHKETLLVIMLGGEIPYEKNTNEAYNDRHIVHKEINDKLKDYASKTENVRLIDVNKYITGQESFYDHFNHYIKPVYYHLAEEMVDIINESLQSDIRNTNRAKMVLIRAKEIMAPLYYKIRKVVKGGK